MNTVSTLLYSLFPLLGFFLMVIGIKMRRRGLVVAALWLCLIALMLHYQNAGGEILGSYFGYKNAAIYTLNLLILLIVVLYLLFNGPTTIKKPMQYANAVMAGCIVVGSFFLLANLWVNARFIENRLPGTPLIQVATFKPVDYCNYRHVFYKVDTNGNISYLCPNRIGLIPSVGYLETVPDYLLKQLPQQVQNRIKNNQKPL